MVKVFWLEPNDRERVWLRRYTASDKHTCTKTGHYCNAMALVGDVDTRYGVDANGERFIENREKTEKPPHSDPRWPLKCDACDRLFDQADEFQLFTRQLYMCAASGLVTTLEDAPPGACWNAWWIADRRDAHGPTGCGYMLGDDHRSLTVKLPDNSDWMIDSRCSNCTLPDNATHHCWVRHGTPENGTLHVDKSGDTCAAGAGSIASKNWHGFLRYGFLTE